eukprot:1068621-Prorocentrum_minimum.AAC.2
MLPLLLDSVDADAAPQAPSTHPARLRDLSSLRLLSCGGSAPPPADVTRAVAAFGGVRTVEDTFKAEAAAVRLALPVMLRSLKPLKPVRTFFRSSTVEDRNITGRASLTAAASALNVSSTVRTPQPPHADVTCAIAPPSGALSSFATVRNRCCSSLRACTAAGPKA